jgi:hypothetical protein
LLQQGIKPHKNTQLQLPQCKALATLLAKPISIRPGVFHEEHPVEQFGGAERMRAASKKQRPPAEAGGLCPLSVSVKPEAQRCA